MSNFSLVNLASVEDVAAKYGHEEIGAARFARESLSATQSGVALHQMHPGKRQAFGHRHKQAEEIYVVLSGSGRARLDDEIIDIARLDALRIAPPVARGFEAGDEGLELLVFGQHFEKDGELLHDWWID